ARPDDIDELGHVSNLVYLRWVLDAAVAHSGAVGWPHARYLGIGAAFVVAKHEIEYVRPVRDGDRLELTTWIEWWQAVRPEPRTVLRLLPEGPVVARAATLWAFVDLATGRPKRIPPEIVADFMRVTA